jgi:hypothetical protein
MSKNLEAVKRMLANDIKFHEEQLASYGDEENFMRGYSSAKIAMAKEYLDEIEVMEQS